MCILALLVTLAAACPAAHAAEKAVTVQWLGHSCFLITSFEGVRIVTDPFPDKLGYPPLHLTADIVLVSHEHFDHNAVQPLAGKPAVVRFGGRAAAATSHGITLTEISAYHYPPEGDASRGKVTLFTFEVDGIRFCHLGDLGRPLTDEQLAAIGAVDVLMIPVGGIYTIGPAEADGVISQLRPKVAIPMHYRTKVLTQSLGQLATLDRFLASKSNVKRIRGDTVRLTKADLPPKTTVYAFMKYSQ
jgi:L-ascorbate metabolism protein UlaG (beta-lactamase superfamily)